jgi:hypothetical protein
MDLNVQNNFQTKGTSRENENKNTRLHILKLTHTLSLTLNNNA